MWSKLNAFARLGKVDRALLVEAFWTLATVRVIMALHPFRRIAASLGEVGGETPRSVPPAHDEVARQVGWAVETAARHVPWNSRCLAQALAAWRMLGRRGIAGTIYFGVQQNPARPFDAHAWLRCGDRLVTGGEPGEQFKVLVNFSPASNPEEVPAVHTWRDRR